MDINKPAKHLEGVLLKDGWIIKENITQRYNDNKKGFAETYLVVNGDNTALLKALDFSVALLDTDPTKALAKLSNSYEFEKQLLELCKSEKLNRIITILAQGMIAPQSGSIIPVPYFILEYAEKDLKSQLSLDSRLDTAWLLKILHNVTVGLWQLHKYGIAHTELRPETILQFSRDLQKLTELGTASRKGSLYGNSSSGDNVELESPLYKTPEYLYGYSETEWVYNSQATDIYNLGDLLFFLFTQSSFNTWLFFFLDEAHKPSKWGGTFEEVLPYLVNAYDHAVNFLLPYIEDEEIRNSLETTIRQLCHPDPKRRGHPKNIQSIGTSMSVERFISTFDRLAKLSEIKLSTYKS